MHLQTNEELTCELARGLQTAASIYKLTKGLFGLLPKLPTRQQYVHRGHRKLGGTTVDGVLSS